MWTACLGLHFKRGGVGLARAEKPQGACAGRGQARKKRGREASRRAVQARQGRPQQGLRATSREHSSTMRPVSRQDFFRAGRQGASTALALSFALLALTGCKLVDQKTFNPQAGVPPKPYVPPAPPAAPPAPPLIELVAGTPEDEWKTQVQDIARRALARKPEALFVVRCLVPPGPPVPPPAGTQGSNAQAAVPTALITLASGDGHAVMQALMDAGVPQAQVEMTAMPDSTVTKPTVRVYVR